MDPIAKRIIIKQGFGSIYTKDKYPDTKRFRFKNETLYFYLFKADRIIDDYIFYAIDYTGSNAETPSRIKTFEMLIHKDEQDIIALLDSENYANFLIAKALIKYKLKEYEN